jgi:hypothetical protein
MLAILIRDVQAVLPVELLDLEIKIDVRLLQDVRNLRLTNLR